MSDTREKKQDPSPKVKELLTGFESGKLDTGNHTFYSGEKPISRPGGAKKLAKEYEKLQEEKAAAKQQPPRTPTSPNVPPPQSPAQSVTSADKAPVPAPAPAPVPSSTSATAPAPAQPAAVENGTAAPAAPQAQADSDSKPAASEPPKSTEPPKTEAPPQPQAISASPSSSTSGKYVQIVYADMERKGFNGQVLDATVSSLKAQGHTVNVSDLYRGKFNPLPTRGDAGVADSADYFLFEESMLVANLNNKASADIRSEQEQLRKADLVIFIYRFLPSGAPAMLQGYINRVLSEGFAADFTSKAMFDQGKLTGKKAVLCMSCLLNADNFSAKTPFGELDGYLRPIQYGSLRYSGFDVLAPQFNDDYYYGGDTQQKVLLDAWNKRLANILNEKALSFA